MNVVMIVPTGVGAEIGGHAGDANAAAKLIASTCDNFITHPNVVNASDINEMPENTLYVEGSILDRFLQGKLALRQVKQNRILVAVNEVENSIVNAVSAARVTLGADIKILHLERPLIMTATKDGYGSATGCVENWKELVAQVKIYESEFDALAINTPIDIDKGVAMDYMINGGVNPWGGVEAEASSIIAGELGKPVAHAPCGHTISDYDEVVDPRVAAEMVSVCYLHCVLKGLHKAPRLSRWGTAHDLVSQDIDCMVSPLGCVGKPHFACIDQKIPIIVVEENTTCMNKKIPGPSIRVKNYLEAAGVIQAMKAGITLESVTRPFRGTVVYR